MGCISLKAEAFALLGAVMFSMQLGENPRQLYAFLHRIWNGYSDRIGFATLMERRPPKVLVRH